MSDPRAPAPAVWRIRRESNGNDSTLTLLYCKLYSDDIFRVVLTMHLLLIEFILLRSKVGTELELTEFSFVTEVVLDVSCAVFCKIWRGLVCLFRKE